MQNRNAKKQTRGVIKRFHLLKRTCTCIEYKNQTIKIEKARTQYLSKPRDITTRPSPVANNNPENEGVFIRNIPCNKSYAQARFHQTAQGLPTMLLFLEIASLTLVLN